MTKYDMISYCVDYTQDLQGNNCSGIDIDNLNLFERAYIEADFLDVTHHIKIREVCYIIKHSDIARYTTITNCAFMQVDEKPVLAVELRDKKLKNEDVTVVVVEGELDAIDLLMGFIVNRVEDFYQKLY